MATRREHIEEIRMTKFSIGGELNPLTEDLHQAVKNLSAELYAKDVHFLMELIQNAEDNEYSEGVDPSLEFVITSQDITGTGAPATLLVFNNEKGFSPKNIESICSIGRSTKKGNRKRGYIGEKGIGFKSVFLITAQPYIFSNGYQIRFSEEPCMHCNLGYIVPEWVGENPTLSDIRQIYGSGSALPTTTLILPLKPDKVKPVKQQLSKMHPEVLLFLAKVKRLSVREVNEDPRLNTVTAIAISSEIDFETRKNIDADSYTLHLSAEENGNELETECSYYMWKQKFPVKQDCRDEKRMEVDEWVITLAFPYGERLNRGTSSPGIYAFLPTEMITNLPFIIQADFLLASSRENILLDKKWNQGILNCVPSAFINAFLSLVRTVEDAPVSSLPPFFRFLPVQSSHYYELNVVRESIKAQLVEEDIVPCEPHKGQKFFHKPREVGRLLPAFWNILRKAREVGVSLPNLSSHGKYVLCHSFDQEEYDHILSFLGVEPVDDEWYAKCIQSSNLVVEVSKVFAHHFRQASITKENVESLLSCYRKLEGTPFKFPADLKSCICKEKWLRTRLGDYRSPRECILFCSDWESLYPVCLLPFIDDSDTCYGKNIHEYKQELKSLGVVVEFKDGVKFVPSCLYLPKNPRSISRENALALLDCIHILLEEKDNSFPDVFPQKVSQAWLKTHDGYRPPSRCLLFDSKFGEYLTQTDGPFIDEGFYGSEIKTYREELSAIKVIVEVDKGCPLIASQLARHDQLSTFDRVYKYLSEFKWEPNSKADKRIWIQKENQNGQWVNPEECVLYDKDELFGLQLTVLEEYFAHNLLFFSSAYKVKSHPSIDDYCKLWKVWESSETGLSHDQCCKFWGKVVSKNRNLKTEKALSEALVKVPVTSGSDEILLLNKCDVFLPDDLQLKDLFEKSSTHPLFVWYPQPSLPDLPRTTLLEMYRKIGVRAISESVQKEELSVENGVDEQVIPTEKLIGKVLLRLILGFLACPPIEMEAGTRQKAVQGLLSLTVVETTEPITVNYNLPLSSGEILNVRASRKIRWDREMSKFFTQKIDRSGGHKSIVEFATYFSQVISDGVLWEHTDHIPALSELIKLAFVLEFNEEAVDFLMKSKNLQIFIEDEGFLNSTFSSST